MSVERRVYRQMMATIVLGSRHRAPARFVAVAAIAAVLLAACMSWQPCAAWAQDEPQDVEAVESLVEGVLGEPPLLEGVDGVDDASVGVEGDGLATSGTAEPDQDTEARSDQGDSRAADEQVSPAEPNEHDAASGSGDDVVGNTQPEENTQAEPPEAPLADSGETQGEVVQSSQMASEPGEEVLVRQAAAATDAEKAPAIPASTANTVAKATAVSKALDEEEPSDEPALAYRVHSANKGWLAWASGSIVGVKGNQIEALQLKLEGIDGSISYRVLVEGKGWTAAKRNGATAGTTGKALCLQALRAVLSGSAGSSYDLYYRSYVEGLGWLSWAKNNAVSGTSGFNRPIDRVQFKLVQKSAKAPASSGAATKATYITPPKVSVQTHVQNVGWQKPVGNGKVAGTSGRALRMEAMKISITKDGISGGARYSGHVQNIGWQKPVGNGKLAGTSGRSLRIEALDLELTGEMAKCYDVFYRVHVQNYGWMGWAEATELAGSSGRALRVEAVQVYTTLKGGEPPTKSNKLPFVNSTNIMGPSDKSASQLARWYRSYNGSASYPAATLMKGGAPAVEDFAKIVVQEANAEGVRAEVVFAQAMFETANLRYGGLVKANQYNYCGLKNSNGSAFQSFSDVRQGVRAHVQHLKAYASTRPLTKACVDPRFNLISRGCAPNLGNLSRRWSGESDYGDRVNDYLKRIESYR